jgi:CheY-like chemotaxis protein
MYIFVTLIFVAEFIEKTVHGWTGYILVIEQNSDLFLDILLSNVWWIAELPSLIVFTVMMVAMSTRIYKTYIAARREPEKPRPIRSSRNVLVVSNVKATKNFMRGLFITNGVEYYQASNLVDGFDKLVSSKPISVVLIGLSAIDESGMKARDVIQIVKKENPWCIVVALTRSPNIYELFEVRRSYFDDYVYLPVPGELLIASYERWLSRINRWRQIKNGDRRKKKGIIKDRKGLSYRAKVHNEPQTEDTGPLEKQKEKDK